MIKLLYEDPNNHRGIRENAILRPESDIPNFLNQYDIDYMVKKLVGFNMQQNRNLYFVEPMYLPDKHLFDKIPERTFELLRQQKMRLVISFMHEGFELDMHSWLLTIHQLFDKYNLNKTHRFLIFGNIKSPEMYSNFVKKYNITNPFNAVFGVDYFQRGYRVDYTEGNYGNCVDTINYDKEKDFLNYNGALRPNRMLLVSELKRRNLEQNGFVSFVGRYNTGDLSGQEWHCEKTLRENRGTSKQIAYVKNYINNWEPQYIDAQVEDLERNDRAFDLTHYEKSYFSLVSETLTKPGIFVTEKTFKPIAIGHPFMIYGCKGILEYLRSQGYKTFSNLFDETYDKVDNEVIRLNLILDEIEKFSKHSTEVKQRMYKDALPTIIHNRSHFLNNQNNNKHIKKIFKNIVKV